MQYLFASRHIRFYYALSHSNKYIKKYIKKLNSMKSIHNIRIIMHKKDIYLLIN